jgi:hypothetical protein
MEELNREINLLAEETFGLPNGQGLSRLVGPKTEMRAVHVGDWKNSSTKGSIVCLTIRKKRFIFVLDSSSSIVTRSLLPEGKNLIMAVRDHVKAKFGGEVEI